MVAYSQRCGVVLLRWETIGDGVIDERAAESVGLSTLPA
jgi:hypothetical protein